MAKKLASPWGLPNHVEPAHLVPDPVRSDHYIYPHPSGNTSLDEVYHMPTEFGAQRDADEEEAAIERAESLKTSSATEEAESIIARAQAQAAAIVAEAEEKAKALKPRGSGSGKSAPPPPPSGNKPVPAEGEPSA